MNEEDTSTVPDAGEFNTYSNDPFPSVTASDIRAAAKLDLFGVAQREERRAAERFYDRTVIDWMAHSSPISPRLPTTGELFESLAMQTPEFRKLRLAPDDWLGHGAQIVEVPSLLGDVCYHAPGSAVAIASVDVVTRARFDAWMERVEGEGKR